MQVKGSWDNWDKPIDLVNTHMGTFAGHLDVAPQLAQIEYKFIVDGQWLIDETQANNGNNNCMSILDKQIYPNRSVMNNLFKVRKLLNRYSKLMAAKYKQLYIDQRENDIITITRQDEEKIKSYFLITRQAYPSQQGATDFVNISLKCPGKLFKICEIYYMGAKQSNAQQKKDVLQGENVEIFRARNIYEFAHLEYDETLRRTQMNFFYMPPGLTIIVKCLLEDQQADYMKKLKKILFDDSLKQEYFQMFRHLEPFDINYLMYKSENEEQATNNRGTYNIPNKGKLIYAGFAGLYQII